MGSGVIFPGLVTVWEIRISDRDWSRSSVLLQGVLTFYAYGLIFLYALFSVKGEWGDIASLYNSRTNP